MKTFLRGFLKVAVVLLIVILVLQIFLSLFGDGYVGQRLKNSIRQSSDNRYALRYDDLDLGLLSRSVEFQNLRLAADTSQSDSLKAKRSLIQGTIPHLNISGIGVWDYFFSDALTIGTITLEEPRLGYQPGNPGSSNKKQEQSSFSTLDSTLYHALPNQLKALSVGQFSVNNGRFVLYDKATAQDSSIWVNGLNFSLNNIHVDSTTAQSGRYFITDDLNIEFDTLGRHLSNDLYTFSINNFRLSGKNKSLSTDSLQLQPRYPKHEFARQKGTETDRVTLTVSHITLGDIDFNQSINKRKLYAKTGTIEQPRLQIFHDKSLPPAPPDKDTFPHVAFKQLDTKIKLDTLDITNGYISYAQQKADLNKPGIVSFEKLFATFKGISNYEEDLNDNHFLKLHTRSKVMGTGGLNVRLNFPMGDNNGQHSIKGSLDRMQAASFNEATEYMALVRFKEGILHNLVFSMDLNNYGAQGTLTVDYENFSIDMLKKKNDQLQGEKKFISFIANTFAMHKSNHEPPLPEVEFKFKRTEQKSIFNLWWKSLLTGLKKQMNTF